MPDFAAFSLPLLCFVFAIGAGLVWGAGVRLARFASEISERSGIGQAIIGILLLGAITSLPEISTTTVATLGGNTSMAINNLLGGVAFQVVVIALADLFVRNDALTSMVPSTRTILNALASIVLLVLAAIGVIVGDWQLPIGTISFFPLLIGVTYILCVHQLNRPIAAEGWVPADDNGADPGSSDRLHLSNRRLAGLTALAALAILAGGTLVTLAAEGIAERTGIGTGIVGLTLLAFATSLPELSTAIAAVRLRRAELAIGDILGGNMFDVALILLLDVLDTGPPVLQQVDPASMTAALIGILLTTLVLIGLVARRNATVSRLGYDSISVLVVYVAGMGAIVVGVFA